MSVGLYSMQFCPNLSVLKYRVQCTLNFVNVCNKCSHSTLFFPSAEFKVLSKSLFALLAILGLTCQLKYQGN